MYFCFYSAIILSNAYLSGDMQPLIKQDLLCTYRLRLIDTISVT